MERTANYRESSTHLSVNKGLGLPCASEGIIDIPIAVYDESPATFVGHSTVASD